MRLIEVIIDDDAAADLRKALLEYDPVDVWPQDMENGQVLVRGMYRQDNLDDLLDHVGRVISVDASARAILMSVHATLPRLDEEEEEEEEAAAEEPPKSRPVRILGGMTVTRQELFDNVASNARLTRLYLTMVALSAIVATVGILRDSVAIVIGAMVIAPLLGPNVALALAATLGDVTLGRRAVVAGIAGLLLAIGLAVAFGFFVDVDTTSVAVRTRTEVGMTDMAIALASGAAAAIAVTTGASTSLIGVMVAVALMPPATTAGMLLGDGEFELAGRAGLLLMVNVAAVNLAAVFVFLAQGVRPASWWEERQARRAVRIAVPLWGFALIVLAIGIWLSER